jgi:VCBS repeat-containing protein
VNDGDVTVQQTFTVTVTNTNDAPTFTSSAVTTATEDVAYTYNVTTADVDVGDTRTITAPTKPAWLTLTDNGDGTATLTGTPTNADVGVHNVTLEVNDGDVTVQQIFTVTVANANDAPVFTSVPVTAATEDAAYTYNVTTTDEDAGDTRTITATTKPAWLTLVDNGDGTAILSGTPTNADVGVHNVTLEVNDGDATVQQTFTVTVTNTNDAPTFTSSAVTTATEDVTYTYSIITADVDVGDTRTITAPTKPAWLTFTDNGDGTATLTGTPTNAEVGVHNVTLEVNDGDVTVQQIFTITVSNLNDPPTFTSTPVTTGAEDVAYTYNITTADIDVGDTRTITAPTKPAWLTLVDNGDGTATLTGTPLDANIGPNSVTLEVNDGEATTQQIFTITVVNTNDTPVANPDTNTAVEDGGPVSGNVLTNDTDDDIGDVLSVSAVNGLPANVGVPVAGTYGSVTINSDGSYTYTIDNGSPAVQALGTASSMPELFNYTATDGTASAPSTLTVTVTGANDAPTAVADTNTLTEDTASVSGNVLTNDTDVDGVDTKSVTEVNGSAANVGVSVAGTYGSINIAADGSYTYTLTTTLPAVQALSTGGTLTDVFNYTMADSGALTSSSTLTITITGINDAPVFTSANTANVPENTTGSIPVTASDAEGATPTFSIIGGADQGSFSITPTGVLSFQVAPNFEAPTDTGTNNVYEVQVQATDGTNAVTQTISVTVTNVNEAPVNTVPAAQTTLEDTNRVYSSGNGNQISISDPDGDVTVQVTLTANNGTLSTNTAVGLAFTVGDGTDDATMTFTGTVSVINARLNGLTFKPNLNYYSGSPSTDSITITTNDQGNSGSGGALQDTDATSIDIDPVNDKPTTASYTVANGNPHITQSGIGITISAADSNELKEDSADVDDHDLYSELTVQIVGGSLSPANATLTLIDASTGAFYFEPPGGLSGSGAASFQYQVCDNGSVTLGLAAQCSDPATVQFTITGTDTWFVDDTDAAGCGVTCNGARTKPLVGLNNATLAARGTGDRVFAFSGTYNHGFTMAASERLIGQAATSTFDGHFGVVVPANGTLDSRPTMSGAAVTLQNTVTAANNTLLRGITITSGANKGYVSASGNTTLTVLESSVNSTGNMAVDVTGATNAATSIAFTSTTSSGGTRGISLDGVNGTWSLGSGALNNHTQGAFYLQNANAANITYSGTMAPTTGRAVLIGTADGNSAVNASNGLEAGANVTLSGNMTAGGIAVYESSGGTLNLPAANMTFNTGAVTAIELIDNNGATVNLNGGNLTLTTTNGNGITASQGGTLNITGATVANTITTTGSGRAIEVTGTAAEKMNGTLQFRSINKSGSGTKGISVNHLTGSFSVSGDGADGDTTPDSYTSGGTITGTTERGAELVEISGAVSLGGMTFTNATTSDVGTVAQCGGDLMNNDNTPCSAPIHLQTLPGGTTLHTVDVNDTSHVGLNGFQVTGLTLTNIKVRNGGDDGAVNGGVLMKNLWGTVTVSGSQFLNNTNAQFDVTNTSGTLNNFTVTSSEFTGPSTNSAQGLIFSNRNATMTINVGNGTVGGQNNFHDHFSSGFQYAGFENGSNATITINRNTFSNTVNGILVQVAGVGTTSNATYTIENNTVTTGALSSSAAIVATATQQHNLDGIIRGNTVGTSGVPGSGAVCGGGCNGITVDHQGSGAGSHDVQIIGNTVQRVDSSGIRALILGAAKGNIVITGNLVREPDGATFSAIYVQGGTAAASTSCVTATIGGTVTPGGYPSQTPDARNQIIGAWDPLGFQSEIFVWRKGGTFNIPGLVGAADAWIGARNDIGDATGPDVTISGTPFGSAASCP